MLNLRLRPPPMRSQQLIFRRQPEKALDPNLRIQALKEIHDQIDVFLIPEKREGLIQVLTPQGGVTDHMKVMEFQDVDAGPGHRIRHGKPFTAAVPGKSDNARRGESDVA